MKSLQLESPHAIVVIGIQGSGKTFFARKFADTFKAPFIEQAVFAKASRDEETGQTMFVDVLREIAKTSRSIVVELALSSRVERTEIARELRAAGYTPLFVWVQVDAATAIARSYKTSKTTEAEYRENARRFNPPHAIERALVISGKHTFATQAKAVLRKLTGPRNARPPLPPTPTDDRPSRPQRGQIIVR